jgi:chromate transporter
MTNDRQGAHVPLGALLYYFLRLGTLGFGGPIALAGYMQRDLVDERRWFSQEEFLEGLALAQLSPGPLAAQLAMYLGLLAGRYTGAILVAFAFITPSLVMVMALAWAYVHFGGLPWMQAAFYGIGAAVIAIIARSAVKLVKTAVKKDVVLWCIFIVLFISTAIAEREVVWLFLAGGVITLAIKAGWPRRIPVTHAFALLGTGIAPVSPFVELLAFFAKASLFVFGSGLAIVPFLHGGVVQEHGWLNERQFLDAVPVAMITPGPVVITVAFIGYLVDGALGGIAASLGVFMPILAIVLLLGPHYKNFASNPHLKAFVSGVTAAATGAIAGAVIVLARRSIVDVWTIGIAAATFFILMRWKVPEPLLILGAGLIGLFAK